MAHLQPISGAEWAHHFIIEREPTVKGNNKLILNTATMIEIVQRWVDVEMPGIAETQQVAGVSPSHASSCIEFEIHLTDSKPTKDGM